MPDAASCRGPGSANGLGFTRWAALKNKPTAKLDPNVWYVSGRMARGTERKMVVAKRSDFGIVNAIALDPAGNGGA